MDLTAVFLVRLQSAFTVGLILAEAIVTLT